MTYTGQNMGAGKHDRISLGVVAAMKTSAVVSVVLLVVFWLFSQPIMSIFVTNTEIISIAANGIRLTSLFLIALGGVQILRYMLNGTNESYFVQEEGRPLHSNAVGRIAVARFMADLVENGSGLNKSLGVTN